jgi:hypothetical protein
MCTNYFFNLFFVYTRATFVHMEQKQKFISFRVTPELAAIAKARAKSQHRKMSGYMLNLIEQDCRGIMQETTESVGSPKIVNPVQYQTAAQMKKSKAGKN